MKMIMVLSTLVWAGITAGWGQTFYEASGQTAVFKLTAGARSGPAAIHSSYKSLSGTTRSLSVIATRRGVVIIMPEVKTGCADIAIYDIKGRQIFRQDGLAGTSLRLEERLFTPGIYTMLARVGGKNYSHRFAVSR